MGAAHGEGAQAGGGPPETGRGRGRGRRWARPALEMLGLRAWAGGAARQISHSKETGEAAAAAPHPAWSHSARPARSSARRAAPEPPLPAGLPRRHPPGRRAARREAESGPRRPVRPDCGPQKAPRGRLRGPVAAPRKACRETGPAPRVGLRELQSTRGRALRSRFQPAPGHESQCAASSRLATTPARPLPRLRRPTLRHKSTLAARAVQRVAVSAFCQHHPAGTAASPRPSAPGSPAHLAAATRGTEPREPTPCPGLAPRRAPPASTKQVQRPPPLRPPRPRPPKDTHPGWVTGPMADTRTFRASSIRTFIRTIGWAGHSAPGPGDTTVSL